VLKESKKWGPKIKEPSWSAINENEGCSIHMDVDPGNRTQIQVAQKAPCLVFLRCAAPEIVTPRAFLALFLVSVDLDSNEDSKD
jgi:hypothetical protein